MADSVFQALLNEGEILRSGPPAVCVPMNVDAFVLNGKVCDTGLTRIAPITQPDYRGLRLDSSEIRYDVLPHVDVQRTQPASVNSRVSAVESLNPTVLDPSSPSTAAPSTPPLRRNRLGVYLHWSIPRLYRAASAIADSVDGKILGEHFSSQPTFRLVPNRWLVFRVISSAEPSVPDGQQISGWIIESDRLRQVDEFPLDADLETEASPYVSYVPGYENQDGSLDYQARVLIGAKFPLASWTEQGISVPRIPLTVMNSSNFCFADNTVHNPNVFSMIDNLDYTNVDGSQAYYTEATCHYVVLGWHSSETDDPLGSQGLKGILNDRLLALFCTPTPIPPPRFD